MDLENLSKVERLTLVVCAYRLDPKVSADEFIETLDALVEAVREEERHTPSGN